MITGPIAIMRHTARAAGPMLRIAVLLAALGGTLAAGAAQAQLDSLFGGRDSPPRPPAACLTAAFRPSRPRCSFQGRHPRLGRERTPASGLPASAACELSGAAAGCGARAAANRHSGATIAAAAGATLAPQTLPAQRATLPAPANPPAAAAGRHIAATRRCRDHRDADAEDRKHPRGVRRPGQDHRPHRFRSTPRSAKLSSSVRFRSRRGSATRGLPPRRPTPMRSSGR